MLVSRNTVLVAAALASLFTATGFLSKAWRAAREERAEHRFARGRKLEEAHRYAAAAGEYRAALSFEPEQFRYRLALALALVRLEDWGEAEAHLRELREIDPSNGEVNLMLARIAARRDERTEAEQDYRRAVYGYWPERAAARRIEARFELVDLLAKYGDRKKVLSELLELAGEAPDDAALKTRIGTLLLRNGSAEQAVEVFREALAANRDYGPAWLGMGEAQMARGEFRRAQTAFRNALREAPSSAEARAGLARAEAAALLDPSQVHLSAAERYRRSREVLRQVLETVEECGAAMQGEEEARKLLAAPRRREGDTPRALALAAELWNERRVMCGAPREPVLAAVMARLEG